MINCRADVEEERASLSKNSSTETGVLTDLRKRNISIYAGLVSSTLLLTLAGAGSFLYVAICASQNLHNRMFEKLLGATIYFFDHNPVGKCTQNVMWRQTDKPTARQSDTSTDRQRDGQTDQQTDRPTQKN